jgi:hypothetical protein
MNGVFMCLINNATTSSYRVFQVFGQAKFENDISTLSPSLFSLLTQLPQKPKLTSKVVKTDSKIIILLPKI